MWAGHNQELVKQMGYSSDGGDGVMYLCRITPIIHPGMVRSGGRSLGRVGQCPASGHGNRTPTRVRSHLVAAILKGRPTTGVARPDLCQSNPAVRGPFLLKNKGIAHKRTQTIPLKGSDPTTGDVTSVLRFFGFAGDLSNPQRL